MHYVVTGGAGFIGSHLAEALLSRGHEVTVIDNFSGGRREFLHECDGYNDFTFIEGDVKDDGAMDDALAGVDGVFHLAANPDVRIGKDDTRVHLEQNVMTTYSVLESMRTGQAVRLQR